MPHGAPHSEDVRARRDPPGFFFALEAPPASLDPGTHERTMRVESFLTGAALALGLAATASAGTPVVAPIPGDVDVVTVKKTDTPKAELVTVYVMQAEGGG